MVRVAFLLSILILIGCRGESQPSSHEGKDSAVTVDVSSTSSDTSTRPSTTSSPGHSPQVVKKTSDTRFVRLAPEQTGVDFIVRVDPNHENRRLYHSGFVCGGVAVGDIDQDGLPDIYLVSGDGQNRLFRQVEGQGIRFQDITSSAGVDGGDNWGAGATMADLDNDGDLDIYVCNYAAPNQLYVNDGRGRFVESAGQWRLAIHDACLMTAPCDYDRDGDLDLYLLTNRLYRKGGRPQEPPVRFDEAGKPHVLDEFARYYTLREKSPGKFGIDAYGRPDYFLRNNGDGTFSDVTAAAGIAGHGYGLSATWWDYDADGWLDVYISNDFNDPDYLYRNNGDGTFTDMLAAAIPHTPWFSMGSAAGDLNNDGLFDLLAVDMAATNHFKQKTTMGTMSAERLAAVSGPPPQYMRNSLLINSGTGRFLEAAYMAGLANTDWSWSVKCADLDNDGWQDVFVSNGIIRSFNDSDVTYNESLLIGQTEWDIFKDTPPRPEQNLAFRNQGDLQFEDVSRVWGLNHVGMSYGTVFSDLDNDGDLDLVVANIDEPVSIYRNDTQGGHYLTIQLRGTNGNHFGLGATVRVKTASNSMVRLLNTGSGFLSCDEPLVHFGLGDETIIKTVEVTWPTGKRQTLHNVAVDQRLVIEESAASEASVAEQTEVDPMYSLMKDIVAAGRQEAEFDDFERQPLLPNRLSRLGPGVAWGDVVGDGTPVAFLGGAAGSPSVFLKMSKGRPTATAVDTNVAHEDMGAVFFDCDGDGDQDLYVVSGGIECEPADDVLRDRLYINDGSGGFTIAPDALPDIADSGGPVCAADFDRDGDLDLFVGGRSIPGQYPLSPRSRLLVNDVGQFTDRTADAAPELLETGLVTAAVWTDVNDDGWIDLVVAHEWGPVKTFVNLEGRLEDRTSSSGIETMTGWWNGVDATDVDRDGDLDLIATNFGLNTKYHATHEHPALLYYGDFGGQGRMRLVEAEFEDETLFPIRGRSCSTRAIPSLGERFTSFHDFALADLSQLYSNQRINAAHRFAATTLESTVFLNDGQGHFTARSLPRLAQIAPAFGVQFTEVDGDGIPDVYLVHNFYGPQAETGHMDGGLSLLLLGQGDGTFSPVAPRDSGLVVPHDATSLTLADVNRDSRLDFVVGANEGPNKQGGGLQTFACGERFADNLRMVRLVGMTGNPTAVGARVTFHLSDGTTQTDEVRAGSGYLSQSVPILVFGCPDGAHVSTITVRWPEGLDSRHAGVRNQRQYQISHPRLAQ